MGLHPHHRIALLLAALPLAVAPGRAQQAAAPWSTLESRGLDDYALLGAAMDLDQDTLLLGAPHTCAPRLGGQPLTAQGEVRVWTRRGPGWPFAETQVLRGSGGHPDDAFGISVEVEGDLAFVGASGDDAARDRGGAVYVFERGPNGWVEVQRLVASDAVVGDGFGGAVAYSQGRLLVGAPLEGHGHYAEWGEAYVFERQNGAFVETARFRPPDARRGDWFGYRVDIEGDRAAISSYSDSAHGVGSGSVWIYEFDGRTWRPIQQVSASDGHEFGHFGVDVRLAPASGSTGVVDELLVGSHRSFFEGRLQGGVYVFRPNGPGGAWSEVQKLRATGQPTLAALGASVAYSDRGTIVAGAPGADDGRGRVYEFARAPSGLFELVAYFAPPGLERTDFCGLQVRSAGGTIVASVAHHTITTSAGPLRVGGAVAFRPGDVERARPRCEAPLHSERDRGRLRTGDVVAGMPLELRIEGLPRHAPGLLIVGRGAVDLPASSPVGIGSCLAGTSRRIATFVTDGAGAATLVVPANTPGAAAFAGDTWALEAWSRDPAPPGLARTHALELVARP